MGAGPFPKPWAQQQGRPQRAIPAWGRSLWVFPLGSCFAAPLCFSPRSPEAQTLFIFAQKLHFPPQRPAALGWQLVLSLWQGDLEAGGGGDPGGWHSAPITLRLLFLFEALLEADGSFPCTPAARGWGGEVSLCSVPWGQCHWCGMGVVPLKETAAAVGF